MGPRVELAIDADGGTTFEGHRLRTRRDLAVALFAAAERKPQPIVDISPAPQTSERTIGPVVTLVQTAGIECAIVPGADDNFTGI
jgi:hypothetical protein